jgi:hypothetical protein
MGLSYNTESQTFFPIEPLTQNAIVTSNLYFPLEHSLILTDSAECCHMPFKVLISMYYPSNKILAPNIFGNNLGQVIYYTFILVTTENTIFWVTWNINFKRYPLWEINISACVYTFLCFIFETGSHFMPEPACTTDHLLSFPTKLGIQVQSSHSPSPK